MINPRGPIQYPISLGNDGCYGLYEQDPSQSKEKI